MRQQAAVLVSFVTLLIASALCLTGSSKIDDQRTVGDSPDRVETSLPNVQIVMLDENHPFLYPTDQMFRLFDQRKIPLQVPHGNSIELKPIPKIYGPERLQRRNREFLFPTDQMFRRFETEPVPRR